GLPAASGSLLRRDGGLRLQRRDRLPLVEVPKVRPHVGGELGDFGSRCQQETQEARVRIGIHGTTPRKRVRQLRIRLTLLSTVSDGPSAHLPAQLACLLVAST